MRAASRRTAALIAALSFSAGPSLAQDSEPPDAGAATPAVEVKPAPRPTEAEVDVAALESLSLEELLEVKVITGKVAQAPSEVPAVITIIKGSDIEAGGYNSLAEVLSTVPGFADVFDLVTHEIGVRGVNVGPRNGSPIKFMIDGEAVPYHPSGANFFGPEAIPLQAIDHVEIIRGPGSALYGANAFLGVINVITKSGKSISGIQLTGRAGLIRSNGAAGGGVLLGWGNAEVDAMLALSGDWADRSGLALPATSPALAISAPLGNELTRGDIARPKSAVGHLAVGKLETGRVSAWGSVQNLDASSEFHDMSPMSHDSRVSRLNQHYRLAFDIAPNDDVSVHVAGTYFDSGTLATEQLDLLRPQRVYLPREHTAGYFLVAESTFRPLAALRLTAGADFLEEDHNPLHYDSRTRVDLFQDDGSLISPAGTVTPGAGASKQVSFTNVGLYLQGILHPIESIGITGGVRADVHNIYGLQVSPRIGVTWVSKQLPLNLKLLFGTSFKAPTADQLYSQPVATFDNLGNPSLKPQNAQTLELAGGWRFKDRGEIALSIFTTHLSGLVAYLQTGTSLLAQNTADAWLAGGELEGRYRIVRPLWVRLGVGVAQTLSSQSQRDTTINGQALAQPFYPPVQGHLALDWTLPWLSLRFSPAVTVISPRAASVFNALEAFKVYSVPTAVLVSASLSMPDRFFFGDRPTRFALRVDDLLDSRPAAPGVGGIDYPTLGRTFSLVVTQGF